MSEGIRIILVDRFRLFRRGLTKLLTRRYGMVVVGATDNSDDLKGSLQVFPYHQSAFSQTVLHRPE